MFVQHLIALLRLDRVCLGSAEPLFCLENEKLVIESHECGKGRSTITKLDSEEEAMISTMYIKKKQTIKASTFFTSN